MTLLLRTQCMYGLRKSWQQVAITKKNFYVLSRNVDRKPKPGIRSFYFDFFKKPSQQDLKIKDDIPDSYQLIYRNSMGNYILCSQIISLVTGGFLLMSLVLRKDSGAEQRNEITPSWSPSSRRIENEEFYIVVIFVLVFSLLQIMISRLPLRIYKVPNTKKYTVIGNGNYFFTRERFSFEMGQIVQLEEKGILPWKGNRFLIESPTLKRSLILLDHYFRRPADLNIMLGYQRDPDFEE